MKEQSLSSRNQWGKSPYLWSSENFLANNHILNDFNHYADGYDLNARPKSFISDIKFMESLIALKSWAFKTR
jgi:hypothetical protein